MQKSQYSMTLAIDSTREVFHCYSMLGDDVATISHKIAGYSGQLFDNDFIKTLKSAIKQFVEDTPFESSKKITVVLPDDVVITDVIKIPTMRGIGQTRKTLETTLGGLYRNFSELQINSYIAEQNKQYSSFVIAAIKKDILSSVRGACVENKVIADILTYASSAAVCGASMINPKLKSASYLFLDIKECYSRFVFAVNGKAVGHYSLPFGFEILKNSAIVQEDMLFDHSFAELTVLNAKEKAKSKKLTVMAYDDEISGIPFAFGRKDIESLSFFIDEDKHNREDEGSEDSVTRAIGAEDAVQSEQFRSRKMLVRTISRKSPKQMPDETTADSERIVFENFRVFIKWALTLIRENKTLTELARPEFVCVNLPSELAWLTDKANDEVKENGISFVCFNRNSGNAPIISDLELYAGLFPKQIHAACKF